MSATVCGIYVLAHPQSGTVYDGESSNVSGRQNWKLAGFLGLPRFIVRVFPPEVTKKERLAAETSYIEFLQSYGVHVANESSYQHGVHRAERTLVKHKADGWKHQHKALRVGHHVRWHVKRGIKKADCEHCQKGNQ